MRVAIALTSLLLLGACAEGRWVVRDLSSYSFQFQSRTPAGPFAKPGTAARTPPAKDTANAIPRRALAPWR